MRLGITGYPLSYTQSPDIHRTLLRKTRRSGDYEVLPFDPAKGKAAFFQFLDSLAKEGIRGLNVTIPFKEWAFEYAMARNKAVPGFHGRCAKRVEAANTLVFGGGAVRCANTDSHGFWSDFHEWPSVKKMRGAFELVIVGTGGAARGVVAGVLEKHPAAERIRQVRVVGRNAAKAEELTQLVYSVHPKKKADKRMGDSILVVWCVPPISALAAGELWRQIFPGGKKDKRPVFLYDLNYGVRAEGTQSLVSKTHWRDGSRMLQLQAEASFQLWL
jgi:shikimate dehydrogenase